MKVYETNDIRNVALLGHGHSGKTSLAAGALFASGATARLTRVDEGNTITDFDEEEVARKLTILTAVAAVEWNKKKIKSWTPTNVAQLDYGFETLTPA